MDVLIKFPCIVLGNRSSIIYKIALNWISTLGSLVLTCTYAPRHMHVKEPTDPGESLVGLWNLFFLTWKVSANFNFVACRHKAWPANYSATIDWFVEHWEACSHPSALPLMYCQVSYTWLDSSLDHKHKGKGMWFGFQQPFVGRSVTWQH